LVCQADGGKVVYAVPGVPAEMREMMEGTVLPELAGQAGPSTLVSRTLKVTGVAESAVAEMLDDLFHATTNPSVAYLASAGEVRIRLSAKAGTRAEAEALIEPVAAEVRRRLGAAVFTGNGEPLEQVVARLLVGRRLTVACAESLTGGSLAVRLSTAAGASSYFKGSAVTYTVEAKMAVLGVAERTVRGPGVVSEECAREMAQGARQLFEADVALALTGVAGPEPHDGKEPGTVCVGLAAEDVETARAFRAPGDRAAVRRWAEQAALDMLRRYLSGLPEPADPRPATGSH
jgi:nicotinamide-nucleotide amidase